MSSNDTPTWLSIPSTDPTPFLGLHFPQAVRNFLMMGQVIFHSPTCAMHKEAILSAYMKTLDVTDIRAVAAFCRPYLTEPSSAEEHVQWLGVLVTQVVPLPASAIPAETIDMLVYDVLWRCMIHTCPGCQKVSGRFQEDP